MDSERLLTPAEVAVLFRVDPRTVRRWAIAGRLPSVRTLGGHHRFAEADVEACFAWGSGRS
ncbi:BldC family transcriptional regulator [Fodinicola feengrottensis]|uniref:Developmental transcriptional regulator BldC n=1 Tax=Fodinicola feengrottensis TaxID=435914 RepID=A0ABN2H9R7_9ACTN|nr:BldC family transcriptional regulator [Fodinicola feengrottensis]